MSREGEDQLKQAEEIFGAKPQRTKRQNASIHLAFTMLADALNSSGLEMNKLLRVDIPWTPMTVKEYLFRPIMKAHTTKKSTTELNTKDVSDVWGILMRELGEKKGVENIPFPDESQTQTYLNSFKQ